VTSTTGAFIAPRMTTPQRDALTAVNGMIILCCLKNWDIYNMNLIILDMRLPPSVHRHDEPDKSITG